MRLRATIALIAVAGLVMPAAAAAKGGVIFDKFPDVQRVGAPMKFTAMMLPEGVRALVTFRNPKTGEVVRVRLTRSDLNGLAYGSVALPSHGPWDTEITVAGRTVAPGDAEPFRVGVGLTQTIPAANAAQPAQPQRLPAEDGAPWVWILAAASIGSALLVLAMRRRGRWGAG